MFRDDADEQSFAANRVSARQRIPTLEACRELVAHHCDLLEPLTAFVTARGRLPAAGELPTAPQLTREFGSVARAFSLLRRATGPERWNAIRDQRRADLLVYLAFAAFPKRPRPGVLPEPLRHDIRAFFGSYRSGCAEADTLLFSAGDRDAVDRACRRAPVDKLLPDALYVHHSAAARLPPVLRIYKGCARQHAGSVAGVPPRTRPAGESPPAEPSVARVHPKSNEHDARQPNRHSTNCAV